MLDVLQKSTLAHSEIAVTDPRSRFWKIYRSTADAYDDELLRKYGGDMDMSMIFVGRFSLFVVSFADLCLGWSLLRGLRDLPDDDETRSRPGSECYHWSFVANIGGEVQLFLRPATFGISSSHLDRPEYNHRGGTVASLRQFSV